MPTAVSELFAAAGVVIGGSVPWGTRPDQNGPGVYVASLDRDPSSRRTIPCSISRAAVEQLFSVRPTVTVDGKPASVDAVTNRLRAMWIENENILYVGKATDLASRVGQYYSTKIGARSPHAGGWPIRMLECLPGVWVHYGSAPNPESTERQMIGQFATGVSAPVRVHLVDPDRPYPFANLTGPLGRKRHGIGGAKTER